MKNIFNKRRRERRAFELNVEHSLQNLHSRIGNLELINLMLWGDPKQDGWVGDMQTMRNKLRCMGATQDEVKHINTLTVSTALAVADAKSLAKDAAVNTVEIHKRIQEVFDKLVVMDKRISSAPVWDPIAMRESIAEILVQSKNTVSNIHALGDRQHNIVARLEAIPDPFAEKVLDTIKRAHVTNCERFAELKNAINDKNSTFARTISHYHHLADIQINKIENLVTGRFGEADAENKRLRQQVATLKGQLTRTKNQAKKAAHTSDPKIGFPKK